MQRKHQPGDVLFRCPCPGCNEKAPVKFDKRMKIYLSCSYCEGRIFGPTLVAGYVMRNGGTLFADLVEMNHYELNDILRRYARPLR